MSSFNGAKTSSEELAVASLLEFKILLGAGETTLEDVILVGDEFVVDDEGRLLRIET